MKSLAGAILLTAGIAAPLSGQTMPGSSAARAAGGSNASVLRLSIDDAVKLALDKNLTLQAQRLAPEIQDAALAAARGAWKPTVTVRLDQNRTNVPSTSIFAGSDGVLWSDRIAGQFQWRQALPSGGSYSIAWDNSRVRSNSLFDTPNPALLSTLSGSYVQPLLRDLKIDDARRQLSIARVARDIADLDLRAAVAATVRNAKVAYWELAYAISSADVQRQSLDLARESLRDIRSRLNAGMAARLDVTEAESEVAEREEAVIVSRAAVARAQDKLRTLILDPASAGFWNVTFEPTDIGRVAAAPIDVDGAVQMAVSRRTDALSARKSLDIRDVDVRYFDNQALPDLRVQVEHKLAGQAGTAFSYANGFPPLPVGRQTSGFDRALRDAVDNGSWRVSVSLAYPIGEGTGAAARARARLQRVQQQKQIADVELRIAAEVRDAVRRTETGSQRVIATRTAARLADERLAAEQKKFAAGVSTAFLVFQAQRDFARARNAELRALVDYNTAVVDFDLVQVAPNGSD